MPAYQTTMKDLLGGLKTLFQANSGAGQTLSKLKSIKRGIVPPQSIHPLLTMVPVSERYVERRSSRSALVEREINLFYFERDHRGHQNIRDLETATDQIRDLVVANFTLPDGGGTQRAKQAVVGNIDFSQEDTDRGLLHMAVIPTFWLSDELLPATTSKQPTLVDNPSGRAVHLAIYNDLKALSSTTLSKVNHFSDGDWGPYGTLPAVVVRGGLGGTDIRESGRDMLIRVPEVVIKSPVRRAADAQLLDHLDIVEAVKDGLQADPHLEGHCISHLIERIQYGAALENNELIYETVITTQAISKDNRPVT